MDFLNGLMGKRNYHEIVASIQFSAIQKEKAAFLEAFKYHKLYKMA